LKIFLIFFFRPVLNVFDRSVIKFLGRLNLARSGFLALGRISVARHARLRATDGGQARVGDGVTIDRGADVCAKYGRLEIGARSYIGQYTVICAREKIVIGADCLIAEHVTIRDQDHRFGPGLTTADAGFLTAPIMIGDNVWLGAKVIVLKGVTIGDNVVVGANSVVTSDIPANSVAVGIPARVIRAIQNTP
jgi:carbonic anhydrase/acetyltransferase-like protein (isoleucine patch superfamily)